MAGKKEGKEERRSVSLTGLMPYISSGTGLIPGSFIYSYLIPSDG